MLQPNGGIPALPDTLSLVTQEPRLPPSLGPQGSLTEKTAEDSNMEKGIPLPKNPGPQMKQVMSTHIPLLGIFMWSQPTQRKKVNAV